MGKKVKCAAAVLGGAAFLAAAGILYIGRSAADPTGDVFTDRDYRNIMRDSITGNPRIVDIAMLGAHDAFSSGITAESEPEPPKSGLMANPVLGTVAGGLFRRYSKAQKSSAYDLAAHGVRYFDVRITNDGGVWYTTHMFLSEPLEEPLTQVLTFLGETEKEVVVFDMQHINTGESTMKGLFDYIASVQVDGRSLFDYVRYDPVGTPLGALTYEEVTKGGSGVVILAKTAQNEGCFHYNYEASMRSVWHNKITEEEMLAGIAEEYAKLNGSPDLDRDKFRVNQAQMTGSFAPSGMLASLKGWSLLSLAENFNPVLLEQPEFENWFQVLPILMVDYSDSMKNEFNDRAVEAINSFNQKLS